MPRQAITTKYSNTGASGAANMVASCQAKTIRVPYDHALSIEGNHNAAAVELAVRLGWMKDDWCRGGTWHMGYDKHECGVHVFVPAPGRD